MNNIWKKYSFEIKVVISILIFLLIITAGLICVDININKFMGNS